MAAEFVVSATLAEFEGAPEEGRVDVASLGPGEAEALAERCARSLCANDATCITEPETVGQLYSLVTCVQGCAALRPGAPHPPLSPHRRVAQWLRRAAGVLPRPAGGRAVRQPVRAVRVRRRRGAGARRGGRRGRGAAAALRPPGPRLLPVARPARRRGGGARRAASREGAWPGLGLPCPPPLSPKAVSKSGPAPGQPGPQPRIGARADAARIRQAKAGKKAGDVGWEACRERGARSLAAALSSDLAPLWRGRPLPAPFLALFTAAAAALAGSPAAMKAKGVRAAAGELFGVAALRYDQVELVTEALLQLLHKHEHLPARGRRGAGACARG